MRLGTQHNMRSVRQIGRMVFSSNVAGLPRWNGGDAKAMVGVLGIKDDINSSHLRGASHAPRVIRETFLSDSSNTYCEHGLDIETFMQDFSDIPEQEDVHEMVDEYMKEIIQKKKLYPLTLGGDHSISFPVMKAVCKYLHPNLTIVHFDAHPDLYPDFQNNPHSHASPFARILETPGLCQKLISIGIRTTTPAQRDQIKKYGVYVVEARDFPAHGKDCGDLLKPFIAPDTPVYISFDMDVIEPGMAPGVSHRESGGLTVRQVIDAIHSVPGRVVGADLVEFNPHRDLSGVTAAVATKLMKELASKIVRSNMTANEE